jgi:plasmid segregation protein ParM
MPQSRKVVSGINHTNTIGLDIGYSLVKLMIDDKGITFPSVWGLAKSFKYGEEKIASSFPGDQLTEDNTQWFIGELALSQLRPEHQRKLRGEKDDGNAARLRLAKAALGKALPGIQNGETVHIILSVGLPVDHMRGAPALKAAFMGQHLIHTDQTHFVANISEVFCMPQPYGTLYNSMFTRDGEVNRCHTSKRTGIVDVGTYTVDVALDDAGVFINSQSGSVEAGVHTIQQAVTEIYENEFLEKPDYRTVETIVRTGCANVYGQPHDFSAEIAPLKEDLIEATLGLMNEKWQRGTGIDSIRVAGGGAPIVYPQIARRYPQAVLVDDFQLSNAIGYLNFARFRGRS